MHPTPPLPGLYVVSLSNEHPISVNADRARADRCIFVNNSNCKFGRAQNLARRHRDYIRTFGAENVTFEVIVLTESPAQLEAAVLARLSNFRIRGLSGRMNEWLAGTTLAEVKRIIVEVAAQQPTFEADLSLTVQVDNRDAVQFAQPASVAIASTSEIVEAARYLRDAGMSLQLLKDLHHFPARKETYSSTLKYFSVKRDLRPVNVAYGARLLYVEQAHRNAGGPFEPLVSKALAQYPLNSDA